MRKKGAESEASVMEDRYKHEMVIWSRVSVNIAEVRHGLLIKRGDRFKFCVNSKN